MTVWRAGRQRRLLLLAVPLLLAGCAAPPRPSAEPGELQLHGRLALRVTAPTASSLSAEFDLQGTPQQGRLELVSPLGLTVARMQWNAQGAVLSASGKTQNFASLRELAWQATGVDIPVDLLFDWARGIATPSPGWVVDTREHAQGRISAQRTGEDLQAELRLLIEP